MRSRKQSRFALAGAALLLGACNIERSVADDCWIDRGALESANRFRLGLSARNVPSDDGAWAYAETRIARARKGLRACEDGASGSGRPDVADLSHGHSPGGGSHGSAAGEQGA